MFLQERIRDLGRRVVSFPVREMEIERLRLDLQTLEERLNSVETERNELELECSRLRRNFLQTGHNIYGILLELIYKDSNSMK